nr:ribonuclease P protein component [Acuticoccus sediminis]
MKRRSEFKAVAKGVRVHKPGFTLQARRRDEANEAVSGPRVGFTVTKKVGNAVVRNRIKRRLRAIASEIHDEFDSATDYVIVARREALGEPFADLGEELRQALGAAGAKLDRPEVRKRA